MANRTSSSPVLFARGASGSYRKKENVFALAECRRDITGSSCQRCVAAAFEDARQVCPFSKDVLIYYDLCSIGFAERNFEFYPAFRKMVGMHADGSKVPSHCTKYNMAVSELIADVADTAAHSSEKIAKRMKALNEVGCRYKLYALAQCSPMLTDKQCHVCLEDLTAAPGLSGYFGGMKNALWCSYRFEPYSFFDISPGKGEETVWIAVGATVAGLVMILSLLTILFCQRKRRLPREKSSSENLGSGSKASKEGEFGAPRAEPGAYELLEKGLGGFQEQEKGENSRQNKEKCPYAFDCLNEIKTIIQGKKIALFLDYDGTLSRIVDNHDEAFMSDDLKEFVRLDELHYSGGHGMEIIMSYETDPYKPAAGYEVFITEATHLLENAVSTISGASVENNVYCVSVHYRNVEAKDWGLVEEQVKKVSEGFPQLRQTRGKMVIEFRPNMKWDKGDAVCYLLQKLAENLQLDRSQILPIYIGDDLTDEDAFKVLREESDGFGIVVSRDARPTEAYYSVRDTTEVMEFLTWLVRWWNASPASEDSDEIVEV
ncbi:hypothetical protein ACQ4PT_065009 [Festuca glaucescens]